MRDTHLPAPTANIKFTADNADLLAKMKQAEQQVGSVESKVSGLNSSFAGLARTAAAYLTVQALMNAARTAETFENTRAAFNRYVSDGEAGLRRLRTATKNTVDDIRLLESANRALESGVSFQVISEAMAFAKLQADQTKDSFENAFNKIIDGLNRSEAGFGRNNTALLRYGITATNTEGILAEMREKLARVTEETDGSSDAVARFDARWKNSVTSIALSIKSVLLPLIESLTTALDSFDTGSLTNRIQVIAEGFTNQAQRFITSADGKDAFSIVVNGLRAIRAEAARGELTIRDIDALAGSIANLLESPETAKNSNLLAALSSARSELLALKPLLNTQVTSTNANFGPDERDFAEFLRLQDEQQRARDKADADAEKFAAKERARLQLEREEIKAKIALGLKSYDDLRIAIDDQYAANNDFISNDKQAYIAWAADKALIYQRDAANADRAQQQVYEIYRNSAQEILQNEYLTQEERFRMVDDLLNHALQSEQLETEQRYQLLEIQKQNQQAYTAFLIQNYQQQIDLLNQLFGQPALQLVDDFFTSGEVRFEEYLKNVLRLIARYAAQTLLLRLFTSLIPFGGAAAAEGGIVGGGFLGGGGILSTPRVPNLTAGLPDLSGLNSVFPTGPGGGSSTPSINVLPTPVQVQILATAEQLAATVHTGNVQRNRSDLSS